MKTKKRLKFWGHMLQSLVIGAAVGVMVGLYQLGMTYVLKGSKYMYSSRNPWVIVATVVAVVILAFANYFILRRNKGVAGSGIPNIEVCIHEHKPTNWKSELPLMFVNSYVSSFVGFPLGSEGPSVVIGGKTAQMVEDIGNAGEDDTTAMACGTGFGCAFLSPLAGMCYIFEESLHKFNVKYLLRGLVMMAAAFASSSLINHHRLLEVEKVHLIPFEHYYVFLMLVVLNVLLGVAFVKAIIGVKTLFAKHKNNVFFKYFGFALFAVMLVLNFLCLSWMGGGASLIASVGSFESIWLLLGVLALRFVTTTLAGGSGKVTGGLVIPMMTFGALTGQAVCNLCNKYLGMSTDVNGVVVLISMCMIFAVVTKTPITATALVYSALANSSGEFWKTWIIIPMTLVSMYVATFGAKLLGSDDLYKLMIATDKKFAPPSAEQTQQSDDVVCNTQTDCSPQTEIPQN